MKKLSILFYILISTVFTSRVLAQKIITISQNKNIISTINISTNNVIGDAINYDVKLEYSNLVLIKKFLPIEGLVNFEVKDYEHYAQKYKNIFSKRIIDRYKYKISTFTKGKHKILGLRVEYKLFNETKVFTTKDIDINVIGVFDEKNKKNYKLKDIKSILTIFDLKIFLFSFVIILLFLFSFYYYFIYKKIIHNQYKKNLSAHEKAFQKLTKLINSNLIKNNDIKNFYIILTEILREYIENRYELNILDKTTYEVYYLLKNINFDRVKILEVKEFLEISDLVKFAKYNVNEDMMMEHFNFVYSFVESTKKFESENQVNGE